MNIFTAAERLAAARHLTPEEFLAQAELALEDSSYPSPDCLLPAEISHFRQHDCWPTESAAEIEKHLGNCMACRTLMKASAPNRKRQDQFANEAMVSGRR